MIFWSSNIGIWVAGGEGRIYYMTTKNFKQFSKAKVLFKNGFPAGGQAGNNGPIDAFICQDGNTKYIMFYKKDDNTGVPNIYYRVANTPEGMWGEEFGPITPSTGDEGPSCIKIGDEYRIYTDPIESDFAYLYISNDLKSWRRKVTNLKMSHGTAIEIPPRLAKKLIEHYR